VAGLPEHLLVVLFLFKFHKNNREKEVHMKTERRLPTITVLIFASLFITFSAVSCFAESKKPIMLGFVSFVPLANEVEYKEFKRGFIDEVNKRAKGELVINVRGGPEAVRPFDLGVSVQKGVIDLATIPTAFFESMVPGADSTKLSIYTAQEERQKGIYDYYQKMYAKAGLHYLGRGEATTPGYFMMFINRRIAKPDDFKGSKLGGSTAFHGLYRRLGAGVTTLPIPEYHSAMERGVVDGLVTSIYVGLQFGLHEVSEYIITPGFYRSTVAVPMSLKKWNSLPKHLQKIMTDVMIEFERKYSPYEAGKRTEALKKAQASGAEILKLSPEIAKWFVEAASEGSWEYAMKRFSKDAMTELRETITQ
jgi:TRAP-type C4-dicarboxylate transport system substrate-binding protein